MRGDEHKHSTLPVWSAEAAAMWDIYLHPFKELKAPYIDVDASPHMLSLKQPHEVVFKVY